jgi:hypothetical protein
MKSGTWWLPRFVLERGLLPDGNLDPRLRQGRGILLNLVASPEIDENGLAYLASPFAHHVLDAWTQGRVPPSPLLDYFLQQGDGVLWCEIAQWCEYPEADVRNLVWFLDHVMGEMQLGWTRRGLISELDLDTLFLDLTRAALWLIHCDNPIDFLYTEHVHDSKHRTVNVLGRNLNEGGESADASFNFRAVIREPVQQEPREVIDSIVSPEMSLSRDTVDRLMENMLYCAACAMCVACAIDVVHNDFNDIDIAPLFVHAVGGELLQHEPQAIDIPSLRLDAQQCEVGAASFAGGLSPSPCKSEGEMTWDRSLQGVGGDRGDTCRVLQTALWCGGGDRLFDYHHVHESPAPRSVFNKVGIG